MIWATLLHWYQPPGQIDEIIHNVVNQSYDPTVSLLERFPDAHITLNINGCLTEQLGRLNPELIERIKRLVEKGQIELVESAKYHPLLPLLPEHEIRRQIQLNYETNSFFFGDLYAPKGFFPPELAYGNRVAKIVSELGYEWLILDEISLAGKLSQESYDVLYAHEVYPNLKLFFNDRQIAHMLRAKRNLNAKEFWQQIKNRTKSRYYLITANDGEVFGHHYHSREEILEVAFIDKDIQTLTLSEISQQYSTKPRSVKPLKATWDTSEEDIRNNISFPLWWHENNEIQQFQWQLAEIALREYEQNPRPPEDPGFIYTSSRNHLDRGLHSCHFWWASANPWWNPDIIVAGATEIIRSIRGLPQISIETKKQAEEIYAKIIELTWKWHWGGEAQKRMTEFDINKKSLTDIEEKRQ